jgi:nitroreductase
MTEGGTTMTVTLSKDEALLLAAAGHARLAPSVHNTQPWSFHLRDGGLELHSDPARGLAAIDPGGRELTMSCGAALYQLRIALAAQGSLVDVTTFPDDARPHVVAVVRIVGHGEPDPKAVALDALAATRQTNRRAFRGHVPEDVIEEMRRVARREGSELQPIVGDDRVSVAVWQQAADSAQVSNPAYRHELRRWVGRRRNDDGIPLAGTVEPNRPAHDLAPRDFALAGEGGIPEGEDEPSTPLFVLVTERDERDSWLAAGQALAAVWLEATRCGLSMQPLSQSIEHPAVRLHIRKDLRLLTTWPQLLLRVGYAAPQPRTPRRPVDEVVCTSDAVA